MKGKSWQRFIVTVLLVTGYFAVIGYALGKGLTELVAPMVAALPPIIAIIANGWLNQAGKEAEKKEAQPNVP